MTLLDYSLTCAYSNRIAKRQLLAKKVKEETRHYRRHYLMRNLGYAAIGASIIGITLYYGLSIPPDSQSKKSSKLEQYVRE